MSRWGKRGPSHDLTGMTFGKLKVLRWLPETQHNHYMYECECQCPAKNHVIVSNTHLMTGHTKSCGCALADVNWSEVHTIHKTADEKRLASVAKSMVRRCTNPNSAAYPHYGGRGIKVCEEWTADGHYQEFIKWALANGYRPGLSIDRIDVNGNYEPSNCRWVNTRVQANNKRTSHYLTVGSDVHTISDWERFLGVRAFKVRSIAKAHGDQAAERFIADQLDTLQEMDGSQLLDSPSES